MSKDKLKFWKPDPGDNLNARLRPLFDVQGLNYTTHFMSPRPVRLSAEQAVTAEAWLLSESKLHMLLRSSSLMVGHNVLSRAAVTTALSEYKEETERLLLQVLSHMVSTEGEGAVSILADHLGFNIPAGFDIPAGG